MYIAHSLPLWLLFSLSYECVLVCVYNLVSTEPVQSPERSTHTHKHTQTRTYTHRTSAGSVGTSTAASMVAFRVTFVSR
jgi:hypothetical protein